jgi:hypothetical protein
MTGCGVIMVVALSGRGPIEHWRMYFIFHFFLLNCFVAFVDDE